MSNNEVYAMNIQSGWDDEDTKSYWIDPENLEEERAKFLNWLNSIEKKFLSQMDAWKIYVKPLRFARILEQQIPDLNDMKDEEFEFEMILNRALYGWRPQ